MKQEIFDQYNTLVYFLGETLGPDYQIVLYDLENSSNTVVSHSLNAASSFKTGAKLSDDFARLLFSDAFSKRDFCTHLPGIRNSISVYRNSYMLIKDSNGTMQGLLCIIFDDSRFIKLHDYLISVAHPLEFVKNHSFHTIHNMEMYDEPSKSSTLPDTVNNLSNIMQNTFRGALMEANLTTEQIERLTQEERILVIRHLIELGFFKLKGAVPYAAQKLGCSSASIYRYLSELKKESN